MSLEEKKTAKKTEWIWIVLMIAVPVVISLFYALYRGLIAHSDPFPGIIWNDEAVYLKLIENYSKYPSPLGYWGFDANHAILGSGPAWSPAIIFPYALLAKIFPAGQYFVFFANLFFATLANFLFWLLVKPSTRQNIRLILFQIFSAPLLLYLTTNMSEIYRYAMAVILAGMIYYVYSEREKKNKIVLYAVIPLFLIYTIQVYTFFAFAVPLYVCGIMKKKKVWLRFLAALLATGIVTGASYYLLHLISSNYNIGKTESLLNAISARDFASAVKSLLFMVKEGVLGILNLRYYLKTDPIYPFSIFAALVLMGIGLYMAFRGKSNPEKKEDAPLGRIIAHSVALFYVMYMTLYTIVPDTFYRGTQIVIFFCLYLLCMSKREYLVRIMLLLGFASVFLMGSRYRYFTADRYNYSQRSAEWEALREDFGEVLQADPKGDLWDNTVLMYTMEPKAICAVPAGLAENFVLTEGTFSEKPKYLLFSLLPAEECDPGWIVRSYDTVYAENKKVLDENYIVIYETDSYRIYQKGQK